MAKKILKVVLLLVILLVVYIGIVLWHGTVTEYEENDISEMVRVQDSQKTELIDSIFSAVIWNVGYGGLGKESDFFYDSGLLVSGKRRVRSKRNWVEKNMVGIQQFIQQTRTDFYLFQEVDRGSRRSFYMDELDSMAAVAPGFSAAFAKNYEVIRVPLPVLEPWNVYGKVNSGLATLSRHQPVSAERLPLPGTFSWPKRIFSLDRCAARTRYALPNGKELVVFNIHNSAYDDGGLKDQQKEFLRALFLSEYQAGNYVVAGGDWNECPPFFAFDEFMPGKGSGYEQLNIEPDFLPLEWKWIYDPTVPTNRKVKDPYLAGETFVTLIDFFLVSPNIRVKQVKGINQGFEYSDHQPVWMEFELRP